MNGERRLGPDPRHCRRDAEQAMSIAMRAGADAAEALVHHTARLEAAARLGRAESVFEGESRGIGLRVLVGGRAAVAYTSDFRRDELEALAARAIALAALCRQDPFAGLPEPTDLAREVPDLALWDDAVAGIAVPEAIGRARRCEELVLSRIPGSAASERVSFARTAEATGFASSAGFVGAYRKTTATALVQIICLEPDGAKRTVRIWTSSRSLADLSPEELLAIQASQGTADRRASRPPPSCEVPVIFAQHTGQTLLANLAAAVLGDAAWRGNTYLAGLAGAQVASSAVTVVDDALLPGAAGSRPFDGEGLPSRRSVVIERGTFRGFLCDSYAARRLGGRSTASAGRTIVSGVQPTISNFTLVPGGSASADLLAVDRGLYVTELMGSGFNVASGEYSQAVSGHWIERGECAFPVRGVTISGNFRKIWTRIDAVGGDLDGRASVRCPSFRVSAMTVSGSGTA